MGRVLAVITAPVTLIDRDLGNLVRQVAFTAIGSSIGGPVGAAVGAAIAGGIAAISRPGLPKPDATATSIKTSRPPRTSAYGTMRLYGSYILYETGSNGAAIDGYAVHDGPMTAAVAYYIGDDKVTWKLGVSYPGGLINELEDGKYGDDTTRFYYTDGRTPGTTVPLIISELPGVWTSAHRGDGVCLIYTRFASVKAKNFNKRYPNGTPAASIVAQWQKCPDAYAVDPTDQSQWTWTENVVRHMLHYKLVRENVDYATKIAPTIAYWRDAQSVCDEPIARRYGQASLLEKSDSGDLTVVLSDVSGLVNGSTLTFTAWAESKTVVSVSGNTVTLNSGVAHDYPVGAGVTWIGAGTEARYRSCIAHTHVERHADVTNTFLQTFDGWMATRQDGALVVYAGKYYAPTVTIGPEHIVSYEWNGVGVDDDTAVNELTCAYISAPHDYNSVECDAWRDEDDITERGQVLSNSLEIQTPSWGQVRRLAKRVMARTNALYRGSVTTNVAGRIARGERYINLHLEEAGTVFYSGPAEITVITRNMEGGGVTFSWVAADPNIDAWNPATEEGQPAALGDRVGVTALETPVIDTAIAEADASGANVAIRITTDGLGRDDITWYARWRVTTDGGAWVEQQYTDVDDTPTVELVLSGLPTDVSVDVAIAYGVGDGRISDWSASVPVNTATEIVYDGGDASTEV